MNVDRTPVWSRDACGVKRSKNEWKREGYEHKNIEDWSPNNVACDGAVNEIARQELSEVCPALLSVSHSVRCAAGNENKDGK